MTSQEMGALGFYKKELEFLIGAMRESLTAGGEWLASRRYPTGPICQVRNLNYIHKAMWGMFVGGVDHAILAEVFDWVEQESLQPTGDFFFPEEPSKYKDGQRAYRPLTFLKVAAWIGHPLASNSLVIERLFQFQHPSGGAFAYIGDDPANVEYQPTLGTLNTTFFGQLMLALGEEDRAMAVGDFLCHFVDANREHMANEGLFYSNMDLEGRLVTAAEPGERLTRVVDRTLPRQEFWQTGTTMAFLADLYEVVRESAGETKAQPYLDAALALLPFEDGQPLEGYLWPSKCKVGWGVGELLRVLVRYGLGTRQQIEAAYEVARRVSVHTFMASQLSDGGWSAMHYPISELDPEYELRYVPSRGRINVPQEEIPGWSKLFLPREELTGEFLGELDSVLQGMRAFRSAL